MIRAVLFDFGQTLVNSAGAFRAAEKKAQTRIFRHLRVTSWERFLANYRRIRKESQTNFNFSRKAIWLQHHLVHRSWPTMKTSVPVITNLDRLLYLESIIF